jgi:hypothetical protein
MTMCSLLTILLHPAERATGRAVDLLDIRARPPDRSGRKANTHPSWFRLLFRRYGVTIDQYIGRRARSLDASSSGAFLHDHSPLMVPP